MNPNTLAPSSLPHRPLPGVPDRLLATPAAGGDAGAVAAKPRKRQRLSWYKLVPGVVLRHVPRNDMGYFVLITEAGTGLSITGYAAGNGQRLMTEQCVMVRRAYNIAARVIMQEHLDLQRGCCAREGHQVRWGDGGFSLAFGELRTAPCMTRGIHAFVDAGLDVPCRAPRPSCTTPGAARWPRRA